MARQDVSLNDRFDLTRTPVLLNGTQALVRLMLAQAARDREAGLNTGGYVTGYRGSPLGAVDIQMRRARQWLDAAGVVFQEGLNEDLAATAIWGTQQAELRGEATPKSGDETTGETTWYILLGVGLGAGVLAGMFGIGGGVVIVPALVTLLRFDQKQAVGTSLAALLLPVSLPAVIEYANSQLLEIPVAVCVALGLLVGAFVGARIALGLSSTTVKRLYGLFLLFVGLRFILQL